MFSHHQHTVLWWLRLWVVINVLRRRLSCWLQMGKGRMLTLEKAGEICRLVGSVRRLAADCGSRVPSIEAPLERTWQTAESVAVSHP